MHACAADAIANLALHSESAGAMVAEGAVRPLVQLCQKHAAAVDSAASKVSVLWCSWTRRPPR